MLPSQIPAIQISNVITQVCEDARRIMAAQTHLAVHDDILMTCDFGVACAQLIERNVDGSGDGACS